jgi:hypothetical protein
MSSHFLREQSLKGETLLWALGEGSYVWEVANFCVRKQPLADFDSTADST